MSQGKENLWILGSPHGFLHVMLLGKDEDQAGETDWSQGAAAPERWNFCILSGDLITW